MAKQKVFYLYGKQRREIETFLNDFTIEDCGKKAKMNKWKLKVPER